MIEQLPESSGKVLGFKMSGKLHDADYKTFVPAVEAAMAKEGKIRLLAQFEDFHGWDLHALWDDIKFSPSTALTLSALPWWVIGNGKRGWPRCASRSPWPKSNTSTLPKPARLGHGSGNRDVHARYDCSVPPTVLRGPKRTGTGPLNSEVLSPFF